MTEPLWNVNFKVRIGVLSGEKVLNNPVGTALPRCPVFSVPFCSLIRGYVVNVQERYPGGHNGSKSLVFLL
jgi:hypothetical protein